MKPITKRRVSNFKKWLVVNGAEVLPPTSEWEAVRFRGAEGVGVLYQNSSGQYKFGNQAVKHAYECYAENKPWSGRVRPTKRALGGSKRKRRLLARDGDCCFFCGKVLLDDVTIEHLVALNQGGPDRMENMVLAHSACNLEAGNMSVIEKVHMRERLHAEPPAAPVLELLG